MMMKVMAEMEAIPLTTPQMRLVRNPETHELVEHLGYDAEMQYKRKKPATRLIICSDLDTVNIGEPVMLTYHSGMRIYQHSRHVSVSNDDNCIGGFYYTNGDQA